MSSIPSTCSLPNHKVTLKESEADSALKVIITSNKAESSSINAKQENRHVYVQTQILFTLISGTLHRVCRFKLKYEIYTMERQNNLLLRDETNNKN